MQFGMRERVSDKRTAARIAWSLEKRLNREELRALCDRETGGELSTWHLDRLRDWVEKHGAYQALPEIPGGEAEATPEER
jgi:hypothetical protein